MKPILILVLASALFGSSCNVQDAPDNDTDGPPDGPGEVVVKSCDDRREEDSVVRILFVGNSLTYSNDLPKLVRDLGNLNGKSVATEMLALPNYALEDHWNDGGLQQLICGSNFDFVVVQQGPSSQADGREMLFDYGQRIKELCLKKETELAFFMVWPAKTNYHMFNGVIKNYTDAAHETNSLLCAVGTEFKQHGDKGDYWFYSADNFHPSQAGSQRAAEIIYSTLLK